MVRECYIQLVKIVEERSGVQLLEVSESGDCEMEDVGLAISIPEKEYEGRLIYLSLHIPDLVHSDSFSCL